MCIMVKRTVMIPKKPKMIFFDYGETVIHEKKFDGIKGYEKLLEYAVENQSLVTAYDLAMEMKEINYELGRFDPLRKDMYIHEITDQAIVRYLLEKYGILLSMKYEEIANLFWDAASEASPTEGIEELLLSIRQLGIGTGIISNISYSGVALQSRLKKLIPSHDFDFVIASSDIVFRKPGKRIFELALKKGNVLSDEVWHCGDQYACDIVGALRVGIQPIWYHNIDNNEDVDEKIFRVSNWGDLQKLLNNYGGNMITHI